MSKGAFVGVSKFFDRPLEEVAKELGYAQDNLLILRGDEEGLREKYPETYQNLLSCGYHADKRTAMEYGRDLVASWLMEDYYLKQLQSPRYALTLSGADRERRILPRAKTSTSSDFQIETPEQQIKLELMNDYGGFWRRTHVLHLRDEKYQSLQRSRALLMAVSVETGEFAIFDFRQEVPARYIECHQAYGYKPAYELSIPQKLLRPIEGDNMARAIAELLE